MDWNDGLNGTKIARDLEICTKDVNVVWSSGSANLNLFQKNVEESLTMLGDQMKLDRIVIGMSLSKDDIEAIISLWSK